MSHFTCHVNNISRKEEAFPTPGAAVAVKGSLLSRGFEWCTPLLQTSRMPYLLGTAHTISSFVLAIMGVSIWDKRGSNYGAVDASPQNELLRHNPLSNCLCGAGMAPNGLFRNAEKLDCLPFVTSMWQPGVYVF